MPRSRPRWPLKTGVRVLAMTYIENGFNPIPELRLPDDEYSRALQRFVPLCTDIVFADRRSRAIALVTRRQMPRVGLWWFGGAMLPNHTLQASAAANLKRETTLDLPEDRFEYVDLVTVQWKDRAQHPQDMGCHIASAVYVVYPTYADLRRVDIEVTPEYEGPELRWYNRHGLLRDGAFPGIVYIYEKLFP